MNNKKDKISDQLTICGTKVLIDVPSNSKLYNPAYRIWCQLQMSSA